MYFHIYFSTMGLANKDKGAATLGCLLCKKIWYIFYRRNSFIKKIRKKMGGSNGMVLCSSSIWNPRCKGVTIFITNKEEFEVNTTDRNEHGRFVIN